MKLILGKKKAKGMTSICEVTRRQKELQSRLAFGLLQTHKMVSDFGRPQNRKQFQKEVDESQDFYNQVFGPKSVDSIDKHTESELYMMTLNQGLKEGKQVPMFDLQNTEAPTTSSNRILTHTILRKSSRNLSRGESPDLSFNQKLSVLTEPPEFENQAFKSFEIEKIDDSRFSGQFPPDFDQDTQDSTFKMNAVKTPSKDKRVSKVKEENEDISDSGCGTERESEGPLIVRESEIKNKENLSQVIRKAVDLNKSNQNPEIETEVAQQDPKVFERKKSEQVFEAGSIQNKETLPSVNDTAAFADSQKIPENGQIEDSAKLYPTESQGGEIHNVFQSEKGVEKHESKVCANGSEEDIKLTGNESPANQSRDQPILASAGSFGNGLTVPNPNDQSNSSMKYQMNRKITFQNNPENQINSNHNSLYSHKQHNNSGTINSPNQQSFQKDNNMKITFEGIENLLPQTHTQMVSIAMNVNEGSNSPKNVKIEVEDNIVINDTMVTEYVDDGTLEKGSFEVASPKGRISGPTGKFQSEVLSSINESHKNTLLSNAHNYSMSRKQSPLPTPKDLNEHPDLTDSGHLRQGIISKASQKLNRQAIQQKVIKTKDNELQDEQESRIASIFAKEKTMIKIEYYDTLLNLERKCDHFTRLFQKIRLRVIHHPFIVLEMLKLMEHRGSAHYNFSALYHKLESMRKRRSLDKLISFVERKREIDSAWGRFAGSILAKSRRSFRKKIEAQKIKEMRKQRHGKVVQRGVRYMATVFNNILRDRINETFSQIERKVGRQSTWRNQNSYLDDGSRVREKTSELRIQGNQGFVIEKSAEKNRRQRNKQYPDYFKKNINQVMADVDVSGSKRRQSKAGSHTDPEDSKERRNKKSRLFFEQENQDKEGQASVNKSGNTSVNHLSGHTGNFGTSPSQRMDGALNKSSKLVIKKSSSKNLRKRNNSIPSLHHKGSQPSLRGSAHPPKLKTTELPIRNQLSRKRMTLNVENQQLMKRINNEIKELQTAVQVDEGEGVPFQAHIDLLGKLTTLLNLVKKYYQGLQQSSFRGKESKAAKKNFEQALGLIRKLMDKLLRKVTSDLATSQMLDKSNRGELPQDEAERNRKHKSLVRIDSMRKRLTQDLNTFIPMRLPSNNETSISSPRKTINELEDFENQTHLDSISDINGLLAELALNLNQMNVAIENQDDIDHTDHNTSNTFGLMGSKMNSNNRYGTATQHDLKIDFSQTSRGRMRQHLHNPQNNDFGEDASGLMHDQNSGGDFIEQNISSRRRLEGKKPSMQYKKHLDESELHPRLKDQLIDACWNLKIKMKKKMKDKKLSAFNKIFDNAVNETEIDKIRKMVSEVGKNEFLLTLAKMTVQVQIRNDLKQQVVQRLNWTWDLKRRIALSALRHALRGSKFDYKRALQEEIDRNKYPGGRFFYPMMNPQNPQHQHQNQNQNQQDPPNPNPNNPQHFYQQQQQQFPGRNFQKQPQQPQQPFPNSGVYNSRNQQFPPHNPNQQYPMGGPQVIHNGQFFQQSMHEQLSQRPQVINGSQYPVDENGFYIDINGLGNYPNEWMEQNQLPNELYIQSQYQDPNNPTYMEQINTQQVPPSIQSGQQGFVQVQSQPHDQFYNHQNPAYPNPNTNQGPQMPHQGHPGNYQQMQSMSQQQHSRQVRQFSQFGPGNVQNNINDDSLYLNLEEEYLHKVSLKQDKKGLFNAKR